MTQRPWMTTFVSPQYSVFIANGCMVCMDAWCVHWWHQATCGFWKSTTTAIIFYPCLQWRILALLRSLFRQVRCCETVQPVQLRLVLLRRVPDEALDRSQTHMQKEKVALWNIFKNHNLSLIHCFTIGKSAIIVFIEQPEAAPPSSVQIRKSVIPF